MLAVLAMVLTFGLVTRPVLAQGGRPAGSFGQCGVFAFYPNKQITTGEGGLIVTDDARIADLCRSMRNQGRDTVEWLKHARLGYNYRMSEINAGEEASVVVNNVAAGKGNYGYNAATGQYGDMVEMGVLDPTKVTRTALQNAASVAALMLTTDCMIGELAEDKPAGGGMGGGMGGMGGMDGMM